MRRVRSTLQHVGFPLVVAAGVNLLVLLFAIVLFSNHVTPSYGVRVLPARTHYVMGSYNRSNMRILTVMPGDTPRFFADTQEIEGGYEGLARLLDSWDCPNPSQLNVIITADEAVTFGVLQRVTDMVLDHGFTSYFAGRPDLLNYE